ncbi:MAG: hypothetical protein IH942_01445 [Acidobacteria bacterium]|nr:hypothetical protein [Acidobacteriota bacterium]
MARKIDFEDPVPDWIPDKVVAEFQHDAEKTVRRSRRRRRRASVAALLGSSEVWWAAFVVFCGLALGAAVIGGLVYAVVVWPWVGLFIVAPAGVLFAVSFVIAARTRERWRGWSVW